MLEIALLVELAIFLALHMRLRRRYDEVLRGSTSESRWNLFTPVFLFAFDKFKVWQRAPSWTIRLHHLHGALLGSHLSFTETKLSMARMSLAAFGAIVGFTLLGIISDGQLEMLAFGVLAAAAAPFIHLRLLEEKLKQRRRSLQMELPEVVTQVLLLTNAGETVQQALSLIVERNAASEKPLYHELVLAVRECRLNVSLSKALDDLQKRCSVQDVTVFVSTLLLHYKRGGDDLSVALRTLSKELWDKRKALARTLGEEASSKLVFPMVLVFVVILVVIASPAVMLMNANS